MGGIAQGKVLRSSEKVGEYQTLLNAQTSQSQQTYAHACCVENLNVIKISAYYVW